MANSEMWSDHSRLDKSLYASKKGRSDSSKSGSGIKRTSSLSRGTPMKQVSQAQAIKDAKWAGIREATIYWLNKLDPDGARCFECGRKAKRLDLDHIVPRGKGGHYTVSNAQLLCRECHSAKHGQPEWSESA